MLKLPWAFDKNEWFVLGSMLCLLVCFIAIPKIMPRGMTLSVLLYFAVLGFTADVLVGVDYPIDFYTIMDSPKLELFDVLVYLINYPIFGYFLSYLLYKYEMRKKPLFFLIPLWCGLSVLFEFISAKLKVFTYHNGWNLGYSALTYPFIFSLSAAVIELYIRIWESRGSQKERPDRPAQNSRKDDGPDHEKNDFARKRFGHH
jgi:hypothetical protein